ncbi:MAG: cytidine deaminase [Lachnospiraceae bacterium]|jgi:cytidine deaminase|nr:cytidine deaminase [Lachnospiraceae bacterium]
MQDETIRMLVRRAMDMLAMSYAPYSRFHVGAALLTKSGEVYGGCNIENKSYPATVCAERTAVFKAISEGEKDFQAICIVGGEDGIVKDYCPPCGICRQVLSEFCEPDTFLIILARAEEDYKVYTMREMLPHQFDLI